MTSGPGVRNPVMYGWQGREYDYESGLNCHRARCYSASVGRWLSQDPIGLRGNDTNFYRYASNSPAFLVDPFGKQGYRLLAIGAGALAGGAAVKIANPEASWDKVAVGATIGGTAGFLGTTSWGAKAGGGAVIGAAASIGQQMYENKSFDWKRVDKGQVFVAGGAGALTAGAGGYFLSKYASGATGRVGGYLLRPQTNGATAVQVADRAELLNVTAFGFLGAELELLGQEIGKAIGLVKDK